MKIAFNLEFRVIVVLGGVLMPKANGTSDVTLSMYMYLANHLTPQECLEFTARLYGEGLELTAVKELEQELPMNEPCLSLLTTWNDSDGEEKNFLNVADSLKKIGKQKLAEWLSDTVFTKLSMDLKECFLQSTTVTVAAANEDVIPTGRQLNIRPEEVTTESCSANQSFISLLLDTIFTYFVLMAIVTLMLYSLEKLINCMKEGQNILMSPKMEYTILEIGKLPEDLSFKDKILDPSLS